MTNIKPLTRFVESDLEEFLATKDDPEEWYVLIGKQCGEYGIIDDHEVPDDYAEFQEELPPEDRDATEPIEGFMQIGSSGWSSKAFDFDDGDNGFVSQAAYGDKIDRRLMNLIVVHESVLSDEALAVAHREEVPSQ